MGAPDAVAHGALDHAELAALGLRPEGLLDFSSNLNASFGLPAWVRVAPRSPAENARLAAAWKEIV